MSLNDFSIEGKKAIVTGGGRGIGRAIATVFAEAGADVAIFSRTKTQLDEVCKEIDLLGGNSIGITCDISDSKQVVEAVKIATDKLGSIDILVNNAGQVAVGPLAPLPEPKKDYEDIFHWPQNCGMTDEVLQNIMSTNLNGSVYMCRAVAPQMIERGNGKIINITSTSSNLAFAYESAYAPSKAALQMLTKVLALEWSPYGLNVNAISPGWFKTEMTNRIFKIEEMANSKIDTIPLKRLTDARDLGLLAVYLASGASDWMTGQVIALDGGESAIAYSN
ncbi:MAG: SDR family oxidoreductase [Chloroflexota bacterium]|jgi:NAD(P)-dependent dehydrogenase (short-subunit alcohol dehydrogenase family)